MSTGKKKSILHRILCLLLCKKKDQKSKENMDITLKGFSLSSGPDNETQNPVMTHIFDNESFGIGRSNHSSDTLIDKTYQSEDLRENKNFRMIYLREKIASSDSSDDTVQSYISNDYVSTANKGEFCSKESVVGTKITIKADVHSPLEPSNSSKKSEII
ncbi:hypothetical protein EDEG_04028 [Edhazardia aedis USNM 41457]|uniref:Uncharacterized protein n=1 Tax=Edhazardia aedis (strain USNM 41457) TaxID=1003232 RepID=J9D146_EDHAE|nr:hypothetical protein EDEG_04028 [Edhazardia aedis USNM 41457]|eukprot:EJW01304.1 hypothetical protein EDEG_04028 [Edhazardia aedis USNM 41457]